MGEEGMTRKGIGGKRRGKRGGTKKKGAERGGGVKK